MFKPQGILIAIATPFDHRGELYKSKVQHNVEKWNRTPLAGYVVAGSTGENVHLSGEEKLQLWEWVAAHAGEGKALIACTGVEGVHETVQLANAAAERGYHAVLVRTPGYYKSAVGNADAQLLYHRSVADQSKIPVLLYNIPQATGIDLSVEVVAELSQHPNIAGIKDSSGNLAKTQQMLAAVRPGFSVLTGSASQLAPALAAGLHGAVLAFANAVPYTTYSIWEAQRTREPEAAADWQKRIEPAVKAIEKYGIAGLKHAMDLSGYFGGLPRLPLSGISPDAKAEIEQSLEGLKG